MSSLYHQLGTTVKGVLNGFDRIVFKGYILPLMYEAGVSSFLRRKKVLNKDYKSWAMEQTKRIIVDAEALLQVEHQSPIKQILSQKDRKNEIAQERRRELNVNEGLIGIWWAMEVCNTYSARFSTAHTFPQMKLSRTRCKHLYYYFDHAEFGLLHIRLQTWFPYHIQIAMNGREWLRRSLERENIGFEMHNNKFLHIEDMSAAQHLLYAQLDTRWPKMLDSFLPVAFPSMHVALGSELSYYWTLWQSEWATDYLFNSYKALVPIGERMIRHAFMTGTSECILRYLDRPLTQKGKPYASNSNDVSSRIIDFQDGIRTRHWVDSNSVKVYFEQNVLRTETTINDPGMFKVYRHKQGASKTDKKELLSMRKGVADISMRADISQKINDRMNAQLAECSNEDTFADSLDSVCKRRNKKGRLIRALDATGKDRELLLAISDPGFSVCGMTNRMLREKLKGCLTGRTAKQASAKISRMLRLLRDHGLIRKLPCQRKYCLTRRGRKITTALAAALSSSTEELMRIAA